MKPLLRLVFRKGQYMNENDDLMYALNEPLAKLLKRNEKDDLDDYVTVREDFELIIQKVNK